MFTSLVAFFVFDMLFSILFKNASLLPNDDDDDDNDDEDDPIMLLELPPPPTFTPLPLNDSVLTVSPFFRAVILNP